MTATIADRDALGLTTLAEGQYINGTYLPRSEIGTCRRCGIQRRIAPGRKAATGMCQDCRTVETRAAKETPEPLTVPLVKGKGGIWKPVPRVERMSAEDLAWAEKNAAEFKQRRPVIYYRPTKRKDVAA